MGSLVKLTRSCGSNIIPGTKAKLYLTTIDELDGWPQTEAEANSGTELGDKKKLAEAFTFQTDGLWREYDILVDTGAVQDTLEGEVGGQAFVTRLPFFIQGDAEQQRELADLIAANSGCMIGLINPKGSSSARVVGDLDNPCFVESIDGGTGTAPGDRVGFQYTIYANTGKTALVYPVSLGISTTAAA
jgi:hypothetical protein